MVLTLAVPAERRRMKLTLTTIQPFTAYLVPAMLLSHLWPLWLTMLIEMQTITIEANSETKLTNSNPVNNERAPASLICP